MRSWLVAGSIAWLAAGCTLDCPDGQIEIDGACAPVVDTDTDPVDSDVETDAPDTDVAPRTSIVRVEWSTTAVPNSNVVVLTCAGRELMRETNFTFYADHEREFDIAPGSVCEVTLTDRDGGLLPPGRLVVCSEAVRTWDAERGRRKDIEPVEVFACVSGCTDDVAENFDEDANLDDGSCTYVEGCTDPIAENYDPAATSDDGTCDYGGFGLVEIAVFTDESPTDTTVRVVCDGAEALRVVPTTAWSTAAVSQIVEPGHTCTVFVDDEAGNEGPAGVVRVCGEAAVSWSATKGDGSGRAYAAEVGTFDTRACSGCTDENADNFDADAAVDDGSCQY